MLKQHYIEVDTAHLISYNTDLATKLFAEPAEMLPLVSNPTCVLIKVYPVCVDAPFYSSKTQPKNVRSVVWV